MSNLNFINNYEKNFIKLVKINKKEKLKLIEVFKILKNLNKKNKILIFGNGGSAAMASHVSVDLTKNAKIKCLNFNESDLITCFSNDYGYSKWMEKSIDFYGESGDILILISSSGKSENVLRAAKAAKKKKFNKIITFSGFSKNNPLRKLGDVNFWVESNDYNQVENIHQYMLLMITDLAINNLK